MILGIGSDLEEIARIERLVGAHGDRFLSRLFTAQERTRADRSSSLSASLAKRFAAKEAFVKALGTGFSDGLTWHDIEIVNDSKGKPTILTHGRAQRVLEELGEGGIVRVHLSLSDTKGHAFAMVVIERGEP